ncbi:hypothetical protein [Roseateles sp. LYH14W]|uniref:2'-5' RNA ligase family protein n=1 Tax=Pelomonas parva TaxID=3299032 RepID=A0ABW7FF37_9BURK
MNPSGFAGPYVRPAATRREPPTEQLDLHGTAMDASLYDLATLTGGPRPLGYTLLLALFPEPADALRIHAAVTHIISAHPMRNARQPADRLHVTLCSVYHAP